MPNLRNIIFILLFFTMSLNAQNIQNSFQSVVTNQELSAAAMVNYTIKKGQFIIENSATAGYRNIEKQLPFNLQTKVRIASISKNITAIGVMQLVEQHKLNLDEDINKILGFEIRNPNFPNKAITARMLLSHTSSIQDGDTYGDFLSATYYDLVMPTLQDHIAKGGKFYNESSFSKYQPGNYFEYANLNYGILGTMIEKLSGERFDEFMQRHILTPLGIAGSYNMIDLIEDPNRAMPYRFDSVWKAQTDKIKPGETMDINYKNYAVGTNAVRFGPHGGLRISVLDLAKLNALLLNDGIINNVRILEKKTVDIMSQIVWEFNGGNGNTGDGFYQAFGLGMQIYSNGLWAKDDIWMGHSGQAYGLVSNAYFNKKKKKGIAFIITGSKHGYQTDSGQVLSLQELNLVATSKNKCENSIPKVIYAHGKFKSRIDETALLVVLENNLIILETFIEPNNDVPYFLPIDAHYTIILMQEKKIVSKSFLQL
jgi:CubicO group peptidase (beta-lactamase class C family)